jgi:hypothetical protein
MVLLVLPAGAPVALAQRNKELPLREIVKLPGKLLSEAKTAKQSGDLKLTGYRVEEVQLPRSINTDVRGQQVVVDRAWRVTITGDHSPSVRCPR